MRFLIDADLPRSAGDVRDIGLRSAKDTVIAKLAQAERLCLITGDYDFADLRNYPPDQYYGLVILYLPRNATAAYINKLLDNFFGEKDLIEQLPGKLAIVEPGRVRLRGIA